MRVNYDARRLAAVPRTGPLVVVANHPFGVVDGLVLCHLVPLVRHEFKVVAMSTLCRVPEVRDYVLPINFAETAEAVATSARSRREARALLKAGGWSDHLSRRRCLHLARAVRPGGRRRLAPLHRPAGDMRARPFPVQFEGKTAACSSWSAASATACACRSWCARP